MTRFVLVLAGWLVCADLNAQEPKTSLKELEGVWQEPAPPGESPGMRHRLVFVNEKLTIQIGDTTVQGTLEADMFLVSNLDGKPVVEHFTFKFEHMLGGGDLFVRLHPLPISSRETLYLVDDPANPGQKVFIVPMRRDPLPIGMDLAPVTIRLKKVK